MCDVIDVAARRDSVRFGSVRFLDLLCRGLLVVCAGLRVALVECITRYWRVLRRRLDFWGGLVFVEGFVRFCGFRFLGWFGFGFGFVEVWGGGRGGSFL